MQRDNWTLDHDLEADSMILSNGEITFNIGQDEGIYVIDVLDGQSNVLDQFAVRGMSWISD